MTADFSGVPLIAGGWRLSDHARRRIAERGFAIADVVMACNEPEQTYTSYQYGPDRWVYQRGHVALAVSPASRTVITVLLRAVDNWDDGDARRANRESA